MAICLMSEMQEQEVMHTYWSDAHLDKSRTVPFGRTRLTNAMRLLTSKQTMSDRVTTILHVSPDTALIKSRTQALSDIGCQVVSVSTVVGALFEISLGRCGILLLCHKLDQMGRCTLADYFHHHCPNPYIVAVIAHKDDHFPPQTHARILFSQDHGSLVRLMRQRLEAA